jgi:hypothetical protein
MIDAHQEWLEGLAQIAKKVITNYNKKLQVFD